MTDAYIDELFDYHAEGVQKVIFPISRLVLDPERFLDDDQEIMAERGMGVIYTQTSSGQRLRYPPNCDGELPLTTDITDLTMRNLRRVFHHVYKVTIVA